MNIYKVNKIFSDKTKSRLITHFWNCKCLSSKVDNLIKKIGTTQSNISKHLCDLKNKKILQVIKKGRERYYLIDPEWKYKWKELVEIQIKNKENSDFICKCKGETNCGSNKI